MNGVWSRPIMELRQSRGRPAQRVQGEHHSLLLVARLSILVDVRRECRWAWEARALTLAIRQPLRRSASGRGCL